jgi:hypothetical protein
LFFGVKGGRLKLRVLLISAGKVLIAALLALFQLAPAPSSSSLALLLI